MKKIPLTNLDVNIYYEKLENGLEIYVAPNNNIGNIYATYTTKFGSRTNEFIPFGEKDYFKVPEGIAHFLEHKAFEQENGVDPFTVFANNGALSNASTDRFKTIYLFEGPTSFEENINCLLDFVGEPYFTDKNVEKEKGIIEQEIDMYKDQPLREGYDMVIFNSFIKNPIRYSVGGTVESIKKISKEDLYKCYNTFYNPNNMFVVVTGNVKPKKTIEMIKKNQESKKRKKILELNVKEYDEPDEVFKDYEEKKMNITVPKVFIAFKFNIANFSNNEDLNYYFYLYFDLKFGPTSKLAEKMKKEGIISNDIEISLIKIDNHMLVIFDVESTKEEELISKIKENIITNDMKFDDFSRKKKALLSACIYMSDSIYNLNNKIINDVINYNHVINNTYDCLKNLSFNKANEIISTLNYNNSSVVIIKPN